MVRPVFYDVSGNNYDGASLYRRKILRLPSNKHSNDSHIIASINSAHLLVRRKILRLYCGLPTYELRHFPLLS